MSGGRSTALAAIAFTLLAATALAGAARAEDSAVEVERLFSELFVERWQAGDAEGLARLWLEDGDWMSMVGSRRIVSGREAIAGVWRTGLAGRDTPEQRALEIEIQSLRSLGLGLAAVDLVMTFGSEGSGLMREGMLAIVRRTADGWRIASARVARIPER